MILSVLCFVLAVPLAAGPPVRDADNGPLPGDLIVNEMFIDPGQVPDRNGEFVELLNVSSRRLSLSGLVLRDLGRDWVMVEEPVEVEPNGVVLMARTGGGAAQLGCRPHFVYGHRFALSNVEDEIIVEYKGIVIDEVFYDVSDWTIPRGHSLALDPLCADSAINDLDGAWFTSWTRLPGGDNGTPGWPNIWQPAQRMREGAGELTR